MLDRPETGRPHNGCNVNVSKSHAVMQLQQVETVNIQRISATSCDIFSFKSANGGCRPCVKMVDRWPACRS
jgi:hypothetical protein